MFLMGGGAEPTEEGDGITNVRTTEDIGISKFPQNLAKGEANRMLNSLIFLGSFRGSIKQANETRASIRGHRNGIMTVAAGRARDIPTMGLENPRDVGFTVQLDILSCLMNI